MPRTRDAAAGLESVITLMAKERQAHVDALAAIEAMLDRWGIRMPTAGRRGRPRKAKRRAGRPRKAAKRATKRRGRPPGRKKKPGTRARRGTVSEAIVQFARRAYRAPS